MVKLAALLVICWNCVICGCALLFFSFYDVWFTHQDDHTIFYSLYATLATLGCAFLLMPCCAIIADAWLGRYKAMVYSIVITWFGTMCGSIAVVSINSKIAVAVSLMLVVMGSTGFLSNVIQFGVDQLPDASSVELSAFLHWWIWSSYCGITTFGVVYRYTNAEIVLWLMAFILLSLFLIFHNCCFSSWLLKEPNNLNAYHQALQVLSYTRKHKHPVGHSAVVWGEASSRLSLAKRKYGGPFDDEFVEEVRYFFKILVFQFSMMGGVQSASYLSGAVLERHLQPSGENTPIVALLSWLLGGFLFVPLYNLLIHPLIWKCSPNMLNRIKIGLVFRLMADSSFLLIDLFGHYLSDVPVSCMFPSIFFTSNSVGIIKNINTHITFLPVFFGTIAYFTSFVTSFEFTLAQAPYSMRGMLIATNISLLWAIPAVVSTVQMLVLANWYPTSSIAQYFSCGSAYFSMNVVMVLVSIVMHSLVDRNYKYRQRPNSMQVNA